MSGFECKPLRDLCAGQPCFLQLPGICTGGGADTVPCHGNAGELGKGGAVKADDCFTAPGCRACHHELDHGSQYSREARRNFWTRAYLRWTQHLWRTGRLAVVNVTAAVTPARVTRVTRMERKTKGATARPRKIVRHPGTL